MTEGGFLVRKFSIQDIFDAIELQGVLEGTAARLAAERLDLEDRRETLLISNLQHSAIAEAIADREGTRADAVTREHSRNARRSVTLALRERRFHRLPGGSLVRIPEAV